MNKNRKAVIFTTSVSQEAMVLEGVEGGRWVILDKTRVLFYPGRHSQYFVAGDEFGEVEPWCCLPTYEFDGNKLVKGSDPFRPSDAKQAQSQIAEISIKKKELSDLERECQRLQLIKKDLEEDIVDRKKQMARLFVNQDKQNS